MITGVDFCGMCVSDLCVRGLVVFFSFVGLVIVCCLGLLALQGFIPRIFSRFWLGFVGMGWLRC